jgi:hypothetical protein
LEKGLHISGHCSLKVVGSVRKLEKPNAMGHRIARVQQLRSTVARRMEGEKVGQMGGLRCIMHGWKAQNGIRFKGETK